MVDSHEVPTRAWRNADGKNTGRPTMNKASDILADTLAVGGVLAVAAALYLVAPRGERPRL